MSGGLITSFFENKLFLEDLIREGVGKLWADGKIGIEFLAHVYDGDHVEDAKNIAIAIQDNNRKYTKEGEE